MVRRKEDGEIWIGASGPRIVKRTPWQRQAPWCSGSDGFMADGEGVSASLYGRRRRGGGAVEHQQPVVRRHGVVVREREAVLCR